MRTPETLRSWSNPLVQRARAAQAGREPGVLALEGARLVRDALAAGLGLELALVDAARPERFADVLAAAREARLVEGALLARLSSLDTAPGVLALAACPPVRPLAALDLAARAPEAAAGLALGVAGIGDPGNLGALARSAEAAGARGLVVARGGARPFGPKALRGSMGSLLRLPVHEVDDLGAALAELTARGVRQAVASLAGGTPYTRFDFSGPFVLWLPGEVGEAGTALAGLPRVCIPMAGAVESLNVTVAGSLLLFAAGRAPRE